MKHIENYVVVIAGASGGIGASIISLLTGKVSMIIAINRTHEGITKSNNSTIEFINTELNTFDAWNKIIKQILYKHKKIDIFIDCIGEIMTGSLENQTINEIEHLFSVNLIYHIYGIKIILPQMIQRQQGQIIEIGSLGGLIPMPFVSTYSASKFALRGLVLSISEEIKNSGVTISLLNPGPVNTKMLQRESENPEAVISFASRAISAEEAAKSVLKLIINPKPEMIIPTRNRFSVLIANLFPNIFLWISPILNYMGSRRRILYRKKFSGVLQ
ncbi:MAG: SDR family NAD(P)-dependent oxidoreductase [Ignavibacteriaceae bacterium]|nr:SDR family NAD(P)-dependent oxidoreductase [Ignavibacteriaceae bacterium]